MRDRALTPKATGRYELIVTELARLDAIYTELSPSYSVKVCADLDAYAAYHPRQRAILFDPKFLDGPRAKSDAHLLDSIRHEYAHLIVEQFAPEGDDHGPHWRELATFLGVTDVHAY